MLLQMRRTPLHWAAENGHVTAVKLLLSHGAKHRRDTVSLFPRFPSSRILSLISLLQWCV